jgi:hypothetical protein
MMAALKRGLKRSLGRRYLLGLALLAALAAPGARGMAQTSPLPVEDAFGLSLQALDPLQEKP